MITHLNDENFNAFMAMDEAVIIDFSATWCGPCARQGELLEEMTGENEALKVGKVDVDECRELAIKYNVSSIPTLLICKGGKISQTFIGLQSKETLLEALAKA